MLLWNALKVSSQIIKVQLATNITILINTHIVNKICAEIIFFPKYIMKYYPSPRATLWLKCHLGSIKQRHNGLLIKQE